MRKVIMLAVCTVLASAVELPVRGADATEEKQVLATMEMLSQAYAKKDMATLAKLYHDDMSYGHSTGEVQTKAEVMEVARTRDTDFVKFSNSTVRTVGATAFFRTTMTIRFTGRDTPTNIWVLWILVKNPQGPQGWQIASRQTFPIPKQAKFTNRAG